MIVSRQNIINTLNILSVRHQKVIDAYREIGPTADLFPDEVSQIHDSHNALSLYNSFKQNYKRSV